MARCMSGPVCTNYRRELGPADIQVIKGQRVCAECWHPVEEEEGAQASSQPSAPQASAAAEVSRQPWPDETPAQVGTSNWVDMAPLPVTEHAGAQRAQHPPVSTSQSEPEVIRKVWPSPLTNEGSMPGTVTPPSVMSGDSHESGDTDNFTLVTSATGAPSLIVYQGGKRRGIPIEMRGDIFVIGRSSRSTLELPDLDFATLTDGDRVSRQHARIIQQGGRYYVEDLHSRRGTWINDEPVPPGLIRPLSHGDWINIAEVAELQFLIPGEA